MAGRWERTEQTLGEIERLIWIAPSHSQIIKELLNNLDQEAFEAGVAWGMEQGRLIHIGGGVGSDYTE